MPPDHPPHRASVQKLFITGLLTLLPIWLTWVVIKFVFVLLSDISKPWVEPLSHRIAATFPQSLGWFNGLWVAFIGCSAYMLTTLANEGFAAAAQPTAPLARAISARLTLNLGIRQSSLDLLAVVLAGASNVVGSRWRRPSRTPRSSSSRRTAGAA